MTMHDTTKKPLLSLLSFCLAFLLIFTTLSSNYLPRLLLADDAESKETDETEASVEVEAKATPITGSGWQDIQNSQGKILVECKLK